MKTFLIVSGITSWVFSLAFLFAFIMYFVGIGRILPGVWVLALFMGLWQLAIGIIVITLWELKRIV